MTESLDQRGTSGEGAGRLWPVNVVIALLAGSTLGAVAATADFVDPREAWNRGGWFGLAGNGWAQAALVVAMLGVLSASAALLRRVAARRVQFCVLLSLLVHFWMAVYLHSHHLPFPFAARDASVFAFDEPEPERMPDYHWDHVDSPDRVQDFERPLETPLPESGEVRPVERRKFDRPVPLGNFRPLEPDDPHRRLPDPATLKRAELPAARRDELAAGSEISRQELKQTLDPGEAIPMPRVKPGGPAVVARPRAETAATRREEPALPERSQAGAASPPDARRLPAPAFRARPTDEARPTIEPFEGGLAARAQTARLSATAAESPETPRPEVGGMASIEARAVGTGRRIDSPRVGGAAVEPEAHGSPRAATVVTAPRRTETGLAIEATSGAVPLPRAASPGMVAAVEPVPLAGPARPTSSGASELAEDGAMQGASTGIARRTTGLGLAAPSTAESGGTVALGSGGARPALGSRAGARRLTGEDLGGIVGSAGGLARAVAYPELPGGARRGNESPTPNGDAVSPAGKADIASHGPGPLETAAGAGVTGPNQRLGGLQVQIAAPLGAGGLGLDPAPVVGLPSRRARPEGEVVHDAPERFVVARSGGTSAMDARIPEEPKPAFRGRDPSRRAARARAFGGTEATEQAVERGIAFLARHQFPQGHWALNRSPHDGSPGYADAAWGEMHSDTAATGLALLAFLGAGYTHMDGKHQATVRRGLEWLLRNQQPDGRLFTPKTDRTRFAQFYAHAMAAIALCEAYGMTGDRRLREPTQRAIGFIRETQHPILGGWRYAPQLESDTSVSGWMLMALKSAQMAGLEVPPETLAKVSQWLDVAQADGGSRYRYNPYAADTPEQREGRRPNLAMTAEGLLMRMYLGWQQDNPALVAGARLLQGNLPQDGTPDESARDSYYWYYATQVMFQMQGAYWTAWNNRLAPMLVQSQTAAGPLAGSWHPNRPVRDRWGKDGGRHYITTLNLLMLEVTYRHLPLYQDLTQ